MSCRSKLPFMLPDTSISLLCNQTLTRNNVSFRYIYFKRTPCALNATSTDLRSSTYLHGVSSALTLQWLCLAWAIWRASCSNKIIRQAAQGQVWNISLRFVLHNSRSVSLFPPFLEEIKQNISHVLQRACVRACVRACACACVQLVFNIFQDFPPWL